MWLFARESGREREQHSTMQYQPVPPEIRSSSSSSAGSLTYSNNLETNCFWPFKTYNVFQIRELDHENSDGALYSIWTHGVEGWSDKWEKEAESNKVEASYKETRSHKSEFGRKKTPSLCFSSGSGLDSGCCHILPHILPPSWTLTIWLDQMQLNTCNTANFRSLVGAHKSHWNCVRQIMFALFANLSLAVWLSHTNCGFQRATEAKQSSLFIKKKAVLYLYITSSRSVASVFTNIHLRSLV